MPKVVPICTKKRFPCTERTREQVVNIAIGDAEKRGVFHYHIRHGKDFVEWVKADLTSTHLNEGRN